MEDAANSGDPYCTRTAVAMILSDDANSSEQQQQPNSTPLPSTTAMPLLADELSSTWKQSIVKHAKSAPNVVKFSDREYRTNLPMQPRALQWSFLEASNNQCSDRRTKLFYTPVRRAIIDSSFKSANVHVECSFTLTVAELFEGKTSNHGKKTTGYGVLLTLKAPKTVLCNGLDPLLSAGHTTVKWHMPSDITILTEAKKKKILLESAGEDVRHLLCQHTQFDIRSTVSSTESITSRYY